MMRRRTDDVDERWSKQLPDELIEMIVQRLTLVDSIRFAAVCPSWRSVSSQWFQRVNRLPWLLKSVDFDQDPSSSETSVNYSLYSPSEDTAYNLKFPKEGSCSEHVRCSGSSNGWLIMSEIWRVEERSLTSDQKVGRLAIANYLLNPMTGDRIKLPQMTHYIPYWSTASSDPRSPDCIVVTQKGQGFNYCRPGSQEWSWMTATPFQMVDYLKFHNDGKLYVTGRNFYNGDGECAWDDHELAVFVPVLVGKDNKITWYKEKTIKLAPREPWGVTEYSIHGIPVEFGGPSFTLSSKGKLSLAWSRNCEPEPDPPYFPFHVFKIDDGWPGWKNSMDFHMLKRNIWVAYDASEDELVLKSFGDTISVPRSRTFTPTIDERFFGRHCGKLSTFCWDDTEDDIQVEFWFTPNIAK